MKFPDVGDVEYVGVKALADASEQILREVVPEQEKGTVAAVPTERALRFYITEGLIPEPLEKRGPASVFGRGHLIALVAIKKLQSQGLPISVIKTLLQGRSTEDLLKLLGEPVHIFTDESALEEHRRMHPESRAEELVVVDDPEAAVAFSRRATTEPAAREFLESLLEPRPTVPAEPPAFSTLRTRSEPSRRTWNRYEIRPGVELHVEENFSLGPRSVEELSAMLKSLARELLNKQKQKK